MPVPCLYSFADPLPVIRPATNVGDGAGGLRVIRPATNTLGRRRSTGITIN